MITTHFLISALKTRYCLTSDYSVSQLLEVTKNSAYGWKNHNIALGDPTARKVADLLDADVSVIYAAMQAERSNDPISKAIWLGIYAKLGGQQVYENIKKSCTEKKAITAKVSPLPRLIP
ncbi:hypothetical protein SAMN02745857_03898 [Andreprevotia lacus DSM 23236]|jgi:hypothetical protein|uniref:Uncharacterized protein n=1 Tax=Andreprevotia lacus DSM 23236 TaxID=1121001 RepID=A0A1W1Y155_9NEIS|nr:hypothetical protein [Andreprevotia lacus]SMC29531.1 hypothetical protein SAMN02745857_03898 [Andreprevotia lacus DSM 23236]